MADLDLNTAATLTAVASYMKEDYTVHGIVNQINREAPFFARVRKNGKDVRGKYAVIPLMNQGARSAVRALDELDDLPTPGKQEVLKAQLNMKYHGARILLTEPTIQASMTEDGAFEQVVEVETRGIIQDLADTVERELLTGGGGNARIARIASVVSTTVFGLDFPGGSRCYPDLADSFGAKYVKKSDIFRFITGAGVPRDPTALVSAEPDTTVTPNRMTISVANAAVIVGDFIVKASKVGLSGAAADVDDSVLAGGIGPGVEMQGLREIVDSVAGGSYLGVTNTDTWAAIVKDFTLAPTDLSEDVMEQVFYTIEQRGQQPPGAIWTTYSLRNFYATKLLIPEKRYNNTLELQGGYKVIGFNGIPMFVSRLMPPGHMYFLSPEDLFVYNQGGFYWFDRDHFWHRMGDKMAWTATMLYYANFGTPRRNRHGVIRGLNEPFAIV